MAQRTVTLCDGKYIGIETIYTVINGRQINIPEKLKELRAKSQRNELFCPCGCGTNLILVAGDKNLREQHFREKPGTGTYECNMPTEGKTSVDSKIVLKCWLDDKLKANDVESRVPIDTVEDTKRKPEFTFLSMDKKFAIRYWRTRANILDDRLDILTGNLSGIKVVYIVDVSNGGTEGQYPEALMKLQDRQKFCLLLSVQEAEYDKASLKAVFYDKDLDGLWKEVVFAEGSLSDFSIIDNNIIFGENTLEQLLAEAKIGFSNDQQVEKERRAEQERLRAEYVRKMQEEDERRRQEILRQREEAEKKLQQQKEEAEKRRKEFEENRRQEVERQQEEQRQREEDFKRNMQSNFSQQETQVRDAAGNRWIKCEFCGKIAMENEFNSYGGAGHINLGTCKECSANNPAVKQKAEEQTAKLRGKYDPNVCPECGGKLRERSGPYGRFIFDMYLSGIGTHCIAKALNEEGVTTVTGSAWHANTIRGMLTNEKYKGDSLLQKYYTPENMRNTVKNNGQVTQFYVTESHEAIIAPEDWEHVQELIAYNRKQRGIKKGNQDYTNRYPNSHKLICPYCGKFLRRRYVYNKKVEWLCATYISQGKDVCKGIRVRESELAGRIFTEPTVVEEVVIDGSKHYCYTSKTDYDNGVRATDCKEKESRSVLPRVNRSRRTVIKL